MQAGGNVLHDLHGSSLKSAAHIVLYCLLCPADVELPLTYSVD